MGGRSLLFFIMEKMKNVNSIHYIQLNVMSHLDKKLKILLDSEEFLKKNKYEKKVNKSYIREYKSNLAPSKNGGYLVEQIIYSIQGDDATLVSEKIFSLLQNNYKIRVKKYHRRDFIIYRVDVKTCLVVEEEIWEEELKT